MTPWMPVGDAVPARGRPRPERGRAARGRPRTPRCRAVDGSGTAPGLLELDALVHEERRVATVVEDHVRTAEPPSPGQRSACSVHHQYSSSVSPFHANTGTPGVPRSRRRRGPGSRRCCSDAQRTSAPSATSVSMSTAVWIVMCSEPVMRAPASGLRRAVALAQRHEAGHLVLGELDLLAAEVGEGEIGDLEVGLAVGDGRRVGVVVVIG